MGLDGRKYMKDMVNNMKMANKFTFKDGVKGLADMAKWAQMSDSIWLTFLKYLIIYKVVV